MVGDPFCCKFEDINMNVRITISFENGKLHLEIILGSYGRVYYLLAGVSPTVFIIVKNRVIITSVRVIRGVSSKRSNWRQRIITITIIPV